MLCFISPSLQCVLVNSFFQKLETVAWLTLSPLSSPLLRDCSPALSIPTSENAYFMYFASFFLIHGRKAIKVVVLCFKLSYIFELFIHSHSSEIKIYKRYVLRSFASFPVLAILLSTALLDDLYKFLIYPCSIFYADVSKYEYVIFSSPILAQK